MTFPRLAVKFVVSDAPAGAEEEDGDAAVLEHHNASQQSKPASLMPPLDRAREF